MVARSFEPGANVSALAREIGVHASQLFGWRAEALRQGEVELDNGDPKARTGSRSARDVIEIEVKDIVIRVGIDFGEDHLRRVIRAVRSA